jgi:plastocyanin
VRARRAMGKLIGATIVAWAIALGAPAVASESDVQIGAFKFAPATVTVDQGDTVTWSWAGPDTNHTVTSDPGQGDSFDSHDGIPASQVGGPPAGGTYSHTFNTPGSFTYFCRVHTSMKGRVVVNQAAPPAPGATAPEASQQAAAEGHPTLKE